MKHKLLIVDDEETVLLVVRAAFAPSYDVFIAREGVSALEIITKERPDFVFLDVKMPGISGLEVLERIKTSGVEPVVWMLTGDEDLEMAVQTLEKGARGYITKPFDINKLREIVMNAIADAESSGPSGPASEKPWHVKKKK